MECPQKCLCRPVQPRPPRHLQPSALLDQMAIQQQAHRVRAVHAPYLVHIGPGGGLIVRDDGQHLQRRLAELGGLTDLKRLADLVAVLRRGAQLPAVLHPQQPHAPSLIAVIVLQMLQYQLHRGAVHVQRHADAVHRHRLAGGKQYALYGGLDILHFQCIHRSPLTSVLRARRPLR